MHIDITTIVVSIGLKPEKKSLDGNNFYKWELRKYSSPMTMRV